MTEHGRATGHMLNRRRFLATLAATAGAAALAACGGTAAVTDTARPASGTTAAPTTAATGATVASTPAAAVATAGATTGAGATTTAGSMATTAAAPAMVAVAPPGKGKTLKMTRNEEPGFPFIGWSSEDNSSEFTMINIYDGLVRPSKDGQGVEPALATKWDTSTDGKTWTFTLRDAKFSDGKPVTAADVKASVDKARLGEKSQWKTTYKAITMYRSWTTRR